MLTKSGHMTLFPVDDSEEQWLWTDVFASLFLFVSLLVNSEIAPEQTEANTTDTAQHSATTNTVQLYLSPDGHIHKNNIHGDILKLDDILPLAANQEASFVLVGSQNTDGLMVFETLRSLQQANIKVQYLATRE